MVAYVTWSTSLSELVEIARAVHKLQHFADIHNGGRRHLGFCENVKGDHTD